MGRVTLMEILAMLMAVWVILKKPSSITNFILK